MKCELPIPVDAQAKHLCIDSRVPAFLRLDRDGRLRGWGGDCTHYGLANLREGIAAADQVDVLTGLLPMDTENLDIPLVRITSDVYADLHCFAGDADDWILFLDVTAEARRLCELQQTSNDLQLLRKEQDRMLKQLRRSHDELLGIFNQLRLITAIIADDGHIQFLSAAGARYFGRSPAEACGMAWEDLFRFEEDDAARLRDMLRAPAGERSRLRVRAEAASGLHRYCLDIDVKDRPEDPSERILYIYDISEVEELLRMLNDRAQFHGMVGRSKAMQHVFQLIRDVAQVESTVLIEGETGTGKELVARAIHYTGCRKEDPFVIVNCGGLNDSLINSQLFGHKKGAFTDAVRDQEGLFEAADGGTIFLDEIGDIPMNTQTRILRALDQREITRIGETESRRVNIRILAATNKDLTREVNRGRFRLDLLYRIRVARIHLPTLRERRQDLPLLVQFFLQEFRAATGKPVEGVTPEAMRLLMEHRWVGNVRELKNAIESGVIHCKGSHILPAELPAEITGGGDRVMASREYDLQQERARILDALEKTGGKRDEAAALLGISRATLYRRMRTCLLGPDDVPKSCRWPNRTA